MLIHRTLSTRLTQAAKRFPVVTVTGPRQSGKTTLVRHAFPTYTYCSLELPDQRAFALEDPRGFLQQFDEPVILDEAQRSPNLFSYLQVMVDERDRPGHFILTGSQNFLLLQTISQSLAGRCAILHLLPLSLAELCGRAPVALKQLGRSIPRLAPPPQTLEKLLFSGFYPRIHDKRLSPHEWLGAYYQTYLERDVRNVLQVGDLEAFSRFVRLCAGRVGQLVNLSALASDCGITHTTARRWLSVLEASFILFLLRPHHKNWGKRLIKSPKLYFLDTGLLCFLLRIATPQELIHHAARGPIFESFVVSELYKNYVHRGEVPALSFWRDTAGHELDVLIDLGTHLVAGEVKSARTVATDFFEAIAYWRRLLRRPQAPAVLIYAGDQAFQRRNVIVQPWFAL